MRKGKGDAGLLVTPRRRKRPKRLHGAMQHNCTIASWDLQVSQSKQTCIQFAEADAKADPSSTHRPLERRFMSFAEIHKIYVRGSWMK